MDLLFLMLSGFQVSEYMGGDYLLGSWRVALFSFRKEPLGMLF